MIKLIGCIIIIAASTAAGFVLAENLKRRLYQLRELQRAVVQLESEIMYTRTTLPEALLKVAQKSRQPVGKVFEGISERLDKNKTDSVYSAFCEVLEEYKGDISLNKADADIILDLAKALGESDIDGHRKMFLLAGDSLKRNIEEAEMKVTKSTKMYRYLGFSFGAVVAILLI